MPDSLTARAAAAAGAFPGSVLAAAAHLTARVRDTKPLHPQGRVGEGVLEITHPLPELGVPLLAQPGGHRCLVRWSRAMGLPDPWPDIEGLAIRLGDPPADLLFASTGTGPVGRFLLTPRSAGSQGPQSTLLPISTESGGLLFKVTPAAQAEGPPRRFELAVALGGADWSVVGTITVDEWGTDRPTRFDPVENLLAGTRQYPVVRWLRRPAYRAARSGATPRT